MQKVYCLIYKSLDLSAGFQTAVKQHHVLQHSTQTDLPDNVNDNTKKIILKIS